MCRSAFACALTLFLAACGGAGGFGPPDVPEDDVPGPDVPLSSDATLANIRVTAGELSPAFSAAVVTYTAEVGVFAAAIRLIATTNDDGANIQINGIPTDSGTHSDLVELPIGMSTVDVTVTAEDGVTSKTYSVIVTRARPITAGQEAYVKASNTDADDLFGISVAISGHRMIVGASGESSNANGVNGNQANNGASGAGAAYIFERTGTSWVQTAYLKSSTTSASDNFGRAVDISGDTAVVGAPGEDGYAGAAHVFVRDGGAWIPQAYLRASNTDADDLFGLTVGISGNTVVVGAPEEGSAATGVNGDQADNSALGSGAVYVFVRTGTTWSQQAYLKASNAEGDDGFGWSVAASGDVLIVGAPGEDSNARGVNQNETDNSALDAGAAYVFVRSGAVWEQQAYLKASIADAGDSFGAAVAISHETAVVGAPGEDSGAVDVDGDDFNDSAPDSGAAYAFHRMGAAWEQQAYLKGADSNADDTFGTEVAIHQNTVIVTAVGEGSDAVGVNGDPYNNLAPLSGAAFVYIREGFTWTRSAYLKASNTEGADAFGISIDVDDGTIVAGSLLEASIATGIDGNEANNLAPAAGAVYVIR